MENSLHSKLQPPSVPKMLEQVPAVTAKKSEALEKLLNLPQLFVSYLEVKKDLGNLNWRGFLGYCLSLPLPIHHSRQHLSRHYGLLQLKCPLLEWRLVTVGESLLSNEFIEEAFGWLSLVAPTAQGTSALVIGQNQIRWLISLPHQSELPYAKPPGSLMLIPLRSSEIAGWLIRPNTAFNVSRTGSV